MRCLFGMRQQFIAVNRTPWWCSTSSRKNREKGERQARSLSLMGTSPRAVPMPASWLITRDGKEGGTWGVVEGTERQRLVWWQTGTTRHWSHSAVTGQSRTATLSLFLCFTAAFLVWHIHREFHKFKFILTSLFFSLSNSAKQISAESIIKRWCASSLRIPWEISILNIQIFPFKNVCHLSSSYLVYSVQWNCFCYEDTSANGHSQVNSGMILPYLFIFAEEETESNSKSFYHLMSKIQC